MKLAGLIAELVHAHPLSGMLVVACALMLVILPIFPRSSSQRRHRHYQKKALRALMRLPQLRDDAARFAWLRKMNPYVFEEVLLTALSRQGYRIRRNARYSSDGGGDGQVWIGERRWIIQAKRYSATINAAHITEFGMLVQREGCRGLFIHTGRTGAVSREVLRHHPDISLISGQKLLMLLGGDRRWQQLMSLNQHEQSALRHPASPEVSALITGGTDE